MPNKPVKNKNNIYAMDVTEYLIKFISFAIPLALLGLCFWAYFVHYKPKEKDYIKKTKYAYAEMSNIIFDTFKEKKAVYTELDFNQDPICKLLAEKLSRHGYNCMTNNGLPNENFKLGKTDITIYGFNSRPYKLDNTIVKDFIIDVNGEKGENELGTDRTILRIYSTGRLGGMIVPVNCSAKDEKNYGFTRAKMCPNGTEINFLATTIPLSYNVTQVNIENGKTKDITTNVSFLRADCAAFGGEMIADEYCYDKNIYILKACYHEHFCNVDYSK